MYIPVNVNQVINTITLIYMQTSAPLWEKTREYAQNSHEFSIHIHIQTKFISGHPSIVLLQTMAQVDELRALLCIQFDDYGFGKEGSD